jgi:hypothetical protein
MRVHISIPVAQEWGCLALFNFDCQQICRNQDAVLPFGRVGTESNQKSPRRPRYRESGMHSVGESLLRSRNSVGRKRKRKQMEPNAFSRRKLATKPQFSGKKEKEKANKREQWSRMHSVGESLLRSRNPVGRTRKRKQMRGSNGTECIQLEKACYEASIPSEAKPTMHHEEKEQAEERVKR